MVRTSAALYPVAVAGLILAIFVVDSVTDRNTIFGIFYVAPVFLAGRTLPPRVSIAIAATCAVLTIVSFLITETVGRFSTGVTNLLMTLGVIAITTLLALRACADDRRLREQAGLLDLTHDSIIVRGMDNVIRYWNRGAEEFYGWPEEQAIGQTTHGLLATVFPAPLDTIEAQLLDTGRWEGELIHTRRDGSRVTVASRWSLHRDRGGRPELVLQTNNDITSRRQAEYLTGHVFEAVPDGMYIVGSDARIQRANSAYGKLFGLAAERVAGMRLAELLGEEQFAEASEPYLRRCFSGVESAQARWITLPTGRRYLRASYSPLRPNTAVVEAALVVVRDLTDEMLAAEAVRTAQAELAHVNRVATMGQLTASIAHEVNQPIHAVRLNANAALRWLAAEPPALAEVREAIARVAQNATRAGAVLDRIRGLVKRAAPQRDSIDINEAIRDVLALTRNETEKQGVTVELALAPDLPPVRGDRVEVQQVVLNLVMNAVEAMTAGHGATPRLLVGTEPDGAGGVRIIVADSGPGIAPEAAQRLFEPFFTTKPQGMGMGLAICRSIVQTHGGRLEVSANEPGGTVFAFTLPAEPGQEGGLGEARVGVA
jgi:PAS domain S-box-containing protein